MSEPQPIKPASSITGYHAHVYFSPNTESEPLAKTLRQRAKEQFNDKVYIGRWHEKPVGPHTTGSFMIAFEPDKFAEVIQWLSLNAVGLNVLIHTETGDDLADHKDHALWLGKQQPLDLSKL